MISEKLKYPPLHRAKLQQLHSDIVVYGTENYDGSPVTRTELITALNVISQLVICGDTLPPEEDLSTFIQTLQIHKDVIDESIVGDLMIYTGDVEWDIPIVKDSQFDFSGKGFTVPEPTPEEAAQWRKELEVDKPQPVKASKSIEQKAKPVSTSPIRKPEISFKEPTPTPKSDILLSPPQYPQLDTTRIFAEDTSGPNHLVIYYSLPEVPTCQREISVTTDITKMRDSDLMNLFPNRVINIRNKDIYTYTALELEVEPNLGYIIPVEGYTRKQLIDNIIKYPQLIKLRRMIDGQLTNFCDNIEINGELFNTLDIWETLPESRKIPRVSGFVIEYVARRYLLERDIKHIQHKYPLFGSLGPFLTLFMSPDDYAKYGYKNPIELARNNVNARVSYKTTRNPILRRIESVRMSVQS